MTRRALPLLVMVSLVVCCLLMEVSRPYWYGWSIAMSVIPAGFAGVLSWSSSWTVRQRNRAAQTVVAAMILTWTTILAYEAVMEPVISFAGIERHAFRTAMLLAVGFFMFGVTLDLLRFQESPSSPDPQRSLAIAWLLTPLLLLGAYPGPMYFWPVHEQVVQALGVYGGLGIAFLASILGARIGASLLWMRTLLLLVALPPAYYCMIHYLPEMMPLNGFSPGAFETLLFACALIAGHALLYLFSTRLVMQMTRKAT